jgi:arabinan endo-1,5-alpha-L-arabinosidase
MDDLLPRVLQVGDGEVAAIRLSDDLRRSVGEPEVLFRASSAPWAKAHQNDWEGHWSPSFPKPEGEFFVTDGPFLHRAEDGSLFMLWSSMGDKGYAMGFARSNSGTVHGPWQQEPKPLWALDGGHGMIFRSFDGKLFVTLHQPNQTPQERAVFRELRFEGGTFRI